MVRYSSALVVLAILLSPISNSMDDPLSFRSRAYGVEDGLSQSSVWSILQDRQGFLWFATADGLNRFDGYSFRVFRHVATDSTSLSNGNVWSLCQDKSGTIWMGTVAGIHRYDPPTETFVRLADQPRYKGTYLSAFARSILEDHLGLLWFGTTDGLAILNPANGALRQIASSEFQPVGSLPGVTVLHEDDNGDVWLANREYLFRYERKSGTLLRVPVGTHDEKLAPLSSTKDHEGVYWFATQGHGVWSFNPRFGLWQSFVHDPLTPTSLTDNYLRTICEDNDGRLWCGTVWKGICYLDRSTGQFHSVKSSDEPTKNARYEGVTAIVRDRSGLLWVGYDGGGMVKLNPYPNKFRHVLLPPSDAPATGDNFFKALIVDHTGDIWLGMYDQGLSVLNPSTGKVKRYGRQQGLSSNTVISLLEDRAGNVWIGTTQGLDRFDSQTGRLTHHDLSRFAPNDPRSRIVSALCEDSLGRVWCGTATHVLRFDRSQGNMEQILSTTAASGATFSPAINVITPTHNGAVWVGTMGGGMFKIRSDGTVERRFTHTTNSLSQNRVKTILIEPDGIMWIGTEEGLNRYDPLNDHWRVYRTTDGLPNDFIYGVLVDSRRHLWISTNRGLSRMDASDPEHPKFRNYTPDDGLQSFEFNTGCYFKTSDGHMLFGGVNGFNIFHPESLEENSRIPEIVLTGFKKFDQPVDMGNDIALMRSVTLSHWETVFSFEFAALEFTNQARNQYAYMMEGFDRDWRDCGTRRDARYTNLNPGEYVFRVKGSSNDGVWNEDGASIEVTIVPPFWKTGWFLVSTTLFGALAFGGTIRYISTRNLRRKIEQLERTKEIQEERLKTRERIARDLHDDLASTVGSAGLYVESLKRQWLDIPLQAKEILEKTGTLLSEAKEAMGDIVWSVSPRYDSLESLLARIRILTADLCRANNMKYDVSFASEDLQKTLSDDCAKKHLSHSQGGTRQCRKAFRGFLHPRIGMRQGGKPRS